jgi:hypothetical protein
MRMYEPKREGRENITKEDVSKFVLYTITYSNQINNSQVGQTCKGEIRNTRWFKYDRDKL